MFPNIKVPTVDGVGQLWFLTVIGGCYFLMCLVKRTRFDAYMNQHIVLGACAALFATLVLAAFNIKISYYLIFFVGYFWNRTRGNLELKASSFSILTAITAVSGMFRIIARKYMDGTAFYECFVARVTMCILAIWIIVAIANCVRLKSEEFSDLVRTKVWRYLDRLSYPLFITHYVFLTGPYDVSKWFGKSNLGFGVFAIATVASAVLLCKVSECLNVKFGIHKEKR